MSGCGVVSGLECLADDLDHLLVNTSSFALCRFQEEIVEREVHPDGRCLDLVLVCH